MKLHRPRSPTLAAVLAGVARLAALTAAVADSALEGLASPRGLTALDDGRLLIAEVGGGRLLILDRQNRLPVLHGGLPRLLIFLLPPDKPLPSKAVRSLTLHQRHPTLVAQTGDFCLGPVLPGCRAGVT